MATAPGGRPRVLWATPVVPSFDGAGGHLRQAHLLAALAAVADIDLLVSGRLDDRRVRDAAATVTELAVHEDDWSTRPRPVRRARDLWLAGGSRRPREVAAFGPVRRAMARRVADFDGDALVIEYAGLSELAPRRPPPTGPRRYLTMHNVGSVMAAQEAAVSTGRQRWLYERDAAVARRFERAVLGRYDGVFTCSEEDRVSLGSPPQAVVVPNGVDLGRHRPSPIPPGPALVFTGALYTGPNVEGIGWFCREVLPRVRARVPAVTLDIVGARPVDEVLALGRLPQVTVHADVASVVPHLDAARVAVVPLHIGSGTRLKALEALGAGRPVVGTTIGLGGLDLVDGGEVLVADDAVAFAEAVIRVLDDDGLAAGLAGAGRRRVEADYRWEAVAGSFVNAVVPREPSGAPRRSGGPSRPR